MNKWIAIVVLDLMVLTAAVGLKTLATSAQTNKVSTPSAKIIGGPVPW
ncbi:MAG: hypothetical protein KGL02_11365 [Acidobacteriota bacterium]|nr:hypothetical protein [Acidobacteriota bacterium]MDE3168955.1 hypothetical protein [Acidobacteriota bacterium]